MSFKSSIFAVSMLLSPLAQATDVAGLINDNLIGYTVADSKVIAKWYGSDRREETSFSGCKPGRVIVFTDNTALRCAEDKFQYANRPRVAILVRADARTGRYDYVMVVGDTVHEMTRY